MGEIKLKITKGYSTLGIVLDIATPYLTYTTISRSLIWTFDKRENPGFVSQDQVYEGLNIQYSGGLHCPSSGNEYSKYLLGT